MPPVLTILFLGFLLGLAHATDADHVAAITTFVSREKSIRYATRIGLLWGIGHSASVTLIAIPIILFSLTIPPQISLIFEFIVGFMLVLLGFLTLTGFYKGFPPIVHSHQHQDVSRPLIVGIVHGLAGSATIALLILSTIREPVLSILYLFIFHFGVIFGMILITTAFGASVILIKRRNETLQRYLVFVSGLFSLLYGLYIMYQTGLVEGLFKTIG